MAKFVFKNTCPSVANYQSQAVENKMLLIITKAICLWP